MNLWEGTGISPRVGMVCFVTLDTRQATHSLHHLVTSACILFHIHLLVSNLLVALVARVKSAAAGVTEWSGGLDKASATLLDSKAKWCISVVN